MKCEQKLVNRIKRLVGQLNGVLTMMEEERKCDEIVTQLLASKGNIEKTISLITTQNLINKLSETENINIENIQKEIDLIIKSK